MKEDVQKENRQHKDSVFVDLFYNDETSKANLLSLYNALYGTDLHDEAQIHKLKKILKMIFHLK